MRISLSACPSPGTRGGFSLLEVVLALAILTGSIVVLGEAIRLGARSAEVARDSTQAQLLCEAKMDEISAGITPPDPVQQVPFDCVVGDGDVGWVYSITQELTEEQGLDLVCVTVTQDLPLEKQPVSFSLFRWIPDPSMQAAAQSEAESLATGGTSE
jgi:general secretion pathway protein I